MRATVGPVMAPLPLSQYLFAVLTRTLPTELAQPFLRQSQGRSARPLRRKRRRLVLAAAAAVAAVTIRYVLSA